MKYTSLFAALAAGIFAWIFPMPASAETTSAKVSSERGLITFHSLTVKLDIVAHTIDATDNISLAGKGDRVLTFALNKNLALSAEDSSGKTMEVQPGSTEGLPEHLAAYTLRIPAGINEVTIAYKGAIYDPIKVEQSLAHVRGGDTYGIIGEEGVYLDGGSGWYPIEEAMLAGFELNASAPQPMLLVAQGDLLGRESAGGFNSSLWRSDIPQDGLTLVGGEYKVQSRKVGEVTLSTYLFPRHEQFAGRLIDATERYLKFYTNLLGDFPYNRFDIVENFFQTGYGMPGYTLLGDAVLDMLGRGGYDVTGPSGVAHELMHNWWGNYVFYDASQGNWCEGLTTYLTNYFWVEANGSPEDALDWRKRTSVRFSLYAPPGKAYPLRQFKWKEKEVDDAVGYGKCAMFFHYVRRLVGDGVFFAALRKVIAEQGGGFAVWADFKKAFEEESGQDLTAVFAEWLDSPGAPVFIAGAERDGSSAIFTITQQEPYWAVKADFTGVDGEGQLKADGAVKLASSPVAKVIVSSGGGDMPFPAGLTYELDPEWHLLRYIPPAALEPCLNAVLNERGAVIVYPSGTDEVAVELLKLADTIRSSGNEVQVIADTEFRESMLAGQSVMLLGGPHVNRAWDKIGDALPSSEFTASSNSFSFRRTVYAAPEDSIVATFANRESPGHFIAVYHGNSVAALARARYIFFYGWESYLIFRAGQVVSRGMSPAAANPWRAELPAVS